MKMAGELVGVFLVGKSVRKQSVTKSLKQRTFNNVAYTGVARIVALVFQAMANIILSRSLSSSDYGLVGFANIFVNFMSQFSDLGLNSAVVQKKQLDDTALYTGFTMKLGIAFSIYLISFVTSGLAVFFFDNPAVVDVIKLMALNFIINVLGSYQHLAQA